MQILTVDLEYLSNPENNREYSKSLLKISLLVAFDNLTSF